MSRSILHVIRSVNPALGGPVEVVRQLALAHREMGVNVEVATLDFPKATWARSFPVPVNAVGERESTTGYGFSKKFVPWLAENRAKYDAVITHGLWQYHNAGTWQALRGTDTPYFVFPHGMLDPWIKKAYPAKHFKKRLYWMWRESHVLRDAKAVLFTCEEERRLAAGTFKPYVCNEKVVPFGIAARRKTSSRSGPSFSKNSRATSKNASCFSWDGCTIRRGARCSSRRLEKSRGGSMRASTSYWRGRAITRITCNRSSGWRRRIARRGRFRFRARSRGRSNGGRSVGRRCSYCPRTRRISALRWWKHWLAGCRC